MPMRINFKVDAPEGQKLVERDGRLYNLSKFAKPARRPFLPLPEPELREIEQRAPAPALQHALEPAKAKTAVDLSPLPEPAQPRAPEVYYVDVVSRDSDGFMKAFTMRSEGGLVAYQVDITARDREGGLKSFRMTRTENSSLN